MKIVVCVNYVADTAIKVKLTADGKAVDLADVAFVVNPYDEFAVEEALQIKERLGGEVIVIGAGPERASVGLRTCLAMGADSAIHIKDDAIDKADAFTVGSALAKICGELKPEIIFFGKHSIGVDDAQVPAVVAEILKLPQVSVVVKLEVQEGKFRAEREIEGAREVVEGALPAAFSAQKGLNTPRYASLKGIMAAKKKQIATRALDTLGLPAESKAQRVSVQKVTLPPSRPPGRILKGDVESTVPELVRLLHEEAKVL